MVVFEPTVESSLRNRLQGMPHADGNQFAAGEDSRTVLGNVGPGVVYLAVQFSDKIGDVHEAYPL
jgi:hypothetical protein